MRLVLVPTRVSTVRQGTEAGLAAVRDWEADHGELTADELAAADALLDRILDDATRRAS